jgi:hypothetical protein
MRSSFGPQWEEAARRGKAVGIANRLELDGPGFESQLGAILSAPVHTGSGVHQAFCKMGTGFLSRGWSGRGVTLNTYAQLAPRLKKEKSFYSASCPSWPIWDELYFNGRKQQTTGESFMIWGFTKNVQSWPDVIMVLEWKRMECGWFATHRRDNNAYGILVKKKWKSSLLRYWRLTLKGTEIEEMECDGVDWLKFVQDTGQWRLFQTRCWIFVFHKRLLRLNCYDVLNKNCYIGLLYGKI